MKPTHQALRNARTIYDALYGFIPITEWEEKIINSPLFQRLRWVKQLSFANYIFPGAEHNRFAHSIGVMHSMEAMLQSTGLSVADHELFNPRAKSAPVMLHKSMRIAALLHDIGTFPFSHAVEKAYLRRGAQKGEVRHTKDGKDKPLKDLPNSHEHLGSFIIKNTRYEGGLTRILEDYGFDIQLISRIIKGDCPHLFANQMVHSDLDADRMDYLMRDAHYTGLKYGQFDRDYILANLVTFETKNGQTGFGVRENAALAVEDFLIARFSWYSQVVRNPASAKFDVISTHLTDAFLDAKLMYTFNDLLEFVERGDERFFWWSDLSFITRCQEIRLKTLIKDPRIQQLNEMLLYRKPPKTLHLPLLDHRLLKTTRNGRKERDELQTKIQRKLAEFETALKKSRKPNAWLLVDIPEHGVSFTRGRGLDAVQVVSKSGEVRALVDRPNAILHNLADIEHFAPNVYANDVAHGVLLEKGLVRS